MIDVCIMTYRPTKQLMDTIDKLDIQTMAVDHVYLMNTEEKYFHTLMYGKGYMEKHKKVTVRHLSKKEFNHGKTRNSAVKLSKAEYFLMMTDDAYPVDEHLVERLYLALQEPNVAVAYARQIAKQDCREAEKYARIFNYPDQSRIKSQSDIPELGIKTFFCSNVCAMYRRDLFDELGGFVNHTIFNEDMLFAYKAIQNGYRIAYVADALVEHSHQYTNRQYFSRSFDMGVSHADHPEIFERYPATGEGRKLVQMTATYLRLQKKSSQILPMYITSFYKYWGYRRGKNYKKMKLSRILKYTSIPEYWEQNQRLQDIAGIDATKGYGRSETENIYKKEVIKKS